MHRPTSSSLVLIALLASACSSAPKGSQNHYEGEFGKPSIHATEKNKSLADALAIVDPRARTTVDGRMEVQFELSNRRSTALQFAWAVDWFGADGFQVSDGSRRFEPLIIGGNGKHVLTIVAPRQEAVRWRLQVTSRDEVQ